MIIPNNTFTIEKSLTKMDKNNYYIDLHQLWSPQNGVFPKIRGKPPKWMVKIMENLWKPMKNWMIWEGLPPLFLVQHPFLDPIKWPPLALHAPNFCSKQPSDKRSSIRSHSTCTTSKVCKVMKQYLVQGWLLWDLPIMVSGTHTMNPYL